MNKLTSKISLNEIRPNLIQKISVIEVIIIFVTLLVFSYLIFSLVSQIYLLNFELKTLITLVQSLQENQIDLKHQLDVKDQQIKLLEKSLNEFNFSSSLTKPLNNTHNLELLKKEVIKNHNELSQFYIKTGGIILGVIVFLKIIKFFL